jgi:flagellar protein FlgJ
MYFGIKDKDGLNGNEQLLMTIEYSRYSNLKFPEIISITPVVKNGHKYFKYVVKDYFRKYDSPAECFIDHANFFFKYPRYADAVKVRKNPYKFVREIAKAGYATDPEYADKLINLIDRLDKILSSL